MFVDSESPVAWGSNTASGRGIEDANQRKLEYYEELVAEVRENGYVSK